jgi:hypothetical protein
LSQGQLILLMILTLGHFLPSRQGQLVCAWPFSAIAPRHFPSDSHAAICCCRTKALHILLVRGHSLPLHQGTSHLTRTRPFAAVTPRHFPSYLRAAICCRHAKALPIAPGARAFDGAAPGHLPIVLRPFVAIAKRDFPCCSNAAIPCHCPRCWGIRQCCSWPFAYCAVAIHCHCPRAFPFHALKFVHPA